MHQIPHHQCCCLTEWVSVHQGPHLLELNEMTQDSIANNTSTMTKMTVKNNQDHKYILGY